MASRLIKLTSLILAAFLVSVTLDVAFNNGEFSHKCLPHPFLERFEGVGEKVGEKLWKLVGVDPIRDELEKHLNSKEELSAVAPLAAQLKGENILESAWNVVSWEDEHMTYDGTRIDPLMKSIPQILKDGKGICGDYTLLTLALLLEMNYSPLYVLAITFNDSDTGHLTAVVEHDGKFYVVDQHPPLMDLASYYRHWAIYRVEYSNESPQHIQKAVLYKVFREGNSVKVEEIRSLSVEDFLSEDYNMTQVDIQRFSSDLLHAFSSEYVIPVDGRLEGAGERDGLPYSAVGIFVLKLPGYADYYLPETERELVDEVLRSVQDNGKLEEALQHSTGIWLSVSIDGNDIKITLYLGR
ncbi:transglutaminase-like domain-containing protein [Thermococcus sp. Bubb.Bath]|uniref:transglutaminase-like domain-containing protein n=1 Tax=Thermococcus sp. Bubb.Bath TaxID=1638242 RepID=UPI00143CA861|nr:transglutaminase-like domain-containing protein [Thermococcus sp. Bubb.Bath]NJF25095.1 hypothetical protein [Thermococcus sp. Bubb.Bath]